MTTTDQLAAAEPAFPTSFSKDYPNEIVGGMSLRDYFAAQCMAGVFIRDRNRRLIVAPQDCAKLAYEWADAMLIERTKPAATGVIEGPSHG